MKLPSYVKVLPLNPFNVRGYMFVPTKTIFLRKDVFDDLRKENPSRINISILIHEEEHRKRMGVMSTLMYVFSPKARLDEELKAYKVQFSYLKKNKETYDLERVARAMSGIVYLRMLSYKKAKKTIENLWAKA